MDDSSRCLLVLLITVFELVVIGLTTPVWSPQQSSTGFGRNIRHLPCLSRRTGETGVCMFAFSCAKANGTHLGTCIDRFYFGSCCKLAEQNDVVAEPLDSNHIAEEFPSLSTENYHISTYQSVHNVKNTTDNLAAQSTTTPRTTPESTTSKPAKKPPTTPKPAVSGTPAYSSKPFTSSKPYTQANTAKPKPSSRPSLKPPSTGKPSSGSKPSLNTTSSKPPSSKPPSSKPPSSKPPSRPPSKPAVSTKPKPSNTTTYAKPGPQKPYNGTITKPSKPSPTKRPTISTSSKPYTHRPVQSTSKPTSKPTSRPKPSSTKPQTKPTTKPVPSVTTTDPNYVKLPVVTAATSQKPPPPSEATTISNEVVQKLTTESPTNTSLENDEESSNVIGPTTSSPLLVTWTTVDEVPVPPLSKPGSTPSSSPVNNEKKPSTTTPGLSPMPVDNHATQSSPTWVQVPVSTPSSGPTHISSPVTDIAKPGTISPLTSTLSTALSTTPTTQNITELPTTAENTTTTAAMSATTAAPKLNETFVSMANTSSASTTAVPEVTTAVVHNEVNTENINMTDYLDVCGRRLFPQSRIVGGDKATFGKWPWQISLRQWRTSTYLHKCGAALLNENWAITAAHCVENVAPSDLLLRLGEHDLSQEDEPYGYQERRVQIVASHPQFDPRTFEYDLALLRFYEPVTFQPNIIPVCVPQDDTNFVGSTAYVTGWGRLYEDGPLPSVLQEVSVPVINNTVCETMYRAAGYIEHIPEIFICAGWKKGGFDSCEGDSGGPMVIQRPDKRWLLAGVISWGIGCAEPNQPGVYTRISEFRGWINQILQF